MCVPLGVDERSRVLPLLVGDLVQRDGASVAGADAADVCEGQQVGDARQAHPGAVQIHVSQVHAF